MKKESIKKLNEKWWGVKRWMEIVDECDIEDKNYEIFCKVLEGYINGFGKLFYDLRSRVFRGK